MDYASSKHAISGLRLNTKSFDDAFRAQKESLTICKQELVDLRNLISEKLGEAIGPNSRIKSLEDELLALEGKIKLIDDQINLNHKDLNEKISGLSARISKYNEWLRLKDNIQVQM